jgi:hypothetical protein
MLVARRFSSTERISLPVFTRGMLLRAYPTENHQDLHSSHSKRVPVLASHPAALWPGDHPDRAFTGLTARTPASLKGHLTRRIYAYLVSSWLTNAIDRIVKELPLNQTGGSARNALTLRSTPSGIASPHPPTPSAGAKLHLSNSPRPSHGFDF